MAGEHQRLATPSMLMALREERQVVHEGFGFLDEKRLLLAAEILRQLQQYETLEHQFTAVYAQAREALQEALIQHGLEGVQLTPTTPQHQAHLEQQQRRILGVTLTRLHYVPDPQGGLDHPLLPSPVLAQCAEHFGRLTELACELAALSGNLERLQEEYKRTERRARALEDVLLPELSRELCDVENRLGELEQEEAVRIRTRHKKTR